MSSHETSPNISDVFFAGCKLKVQKGGKNRPVKHDRCPKVGSNRVRYVEIPVNLRAAAKPVDARRSESGNGSNDHSPLAPANFRRQSSAPQACLSIGGQAARRRFRAMRRDRETNLEGELSL